MNNTYAPDIGVSVSFPAPRSGGHRLWRDVLRDAAVEALVDRIDTRRDWA